MRTADNPPPAEQQRRAADRLLLDSTLDADRIRDHMQAVRLFEMLTVEARGSDPTAFASDPCPRRALQPGHANCTRPCERCAAAVFDSAAEMPVVARIRGRMTPALQAKTATG